MSNTYKRYPLNYFRKIKGKKQAIINNCRPGSIPPDSWDDIPVCKIARIPSKVAHQLYENNISKEQIRKILRTKFHLKDFEIKEILNWIN